MKVALFIDELGNGGAERVTTVLANYFAGKSYDVFLFVTKIGDSQKNYHIDDKIHIIEVPYNKSKVIRIIKRFIFIRKVLGEVGVESCISLTYTFAPYIVATSPKARGRFISSLRNAPQFENAGRGFRILRFFTFLCSDNIVFQTQEAKDFFPSIIKKKGVVIPNPITNTLPMISNYMNNRLIMVCRLEPQKNLLLALDAFKTVLEHNSACILEIYGEGRQKGILSEFIQNNGMTQNVKLMGFSSKIHDILSDGGIYLSTSDFEGISNSMIESMAIGLPVICTDCPVGGARMFISNHVNGILVPVGDKDKIVEAILELLDNYELRRKIGTEAKFIRDRLNSNIICSKWEQLFQNSLTGEG
jgi:glycosyltransferase involved in cell wall biosynthesis